MITSIAIFGATEKYAPVIAESLAADCFNQILLLSDQKKELLALHDRILKNNLSANLEIIDCASEASWQADIIILAVCSDIQKLISERIVGFVTRKILIAFVDSEDDLVNLSKSNVLQDLLPHTHVISVYLTEDQEFGKSFYLSGLDVDALEETSSLLIAAGFNSKTYNTSNTLI
jgi:hypothetical protein